MESDQTTARSHWAVFTVAAVASAAALYEGNLALIAASLGVPIGLIWLYRMLRDRKRRSFRLRALTCATIALLLTAGPAGLRMAIWRAERGVAPTLSALEKFYSATGRYPGKLDDLEGSVAATCGGEGNHPHYAPDSERSHFRLTCVTFGMNKHTYDSQLRSWRSWD